MPLGSSLLNYTTGGRRQLWDILLIQGSSGCTISSAQAKFGSTSLAVNDTASAGQQAQARLGDIIWGGRSGGVPLYPYVTLEFWLFRPGNPSSATTLFSGSPSISYSSQTLTLNGSTWSIGSSSLSTGVWYHIAAARSVDTWGFWIDGVSQGTATDATWEPTTETKQFQGVVGGLLRTDWFIDELRISSVARYDPGVNFTPPAAPFVNDLNTVCLYHFEGTNGDTTTQDDNT